MFMRIDEIIQSPEYMLARHKARQNKLAWRAKQRTRYSDEEERYYDERVRLTPKSMAGYKPNKIPLIRFGLFGKSSQSFLNPEYNEDETLATMNDRFANSEGGVSVYKGMKREGGWEVLPPDTSKSSYNVTNPFYGVTNVIKQVIGYLENGTPIDAFLIYGGLVSVGKAKEYLDVGSDGEYLLDTKQPYTISRLKPEHIFIENHNLIDYLNWMYKGMGGLHGLAQQMRDEEEELRTD